MLSLNPESGESAAENPGPDPNPVEFYDITRVDGRVRCWVWRGYGVRSPLPHLVRHSPDGFEIGYGGSGPADLVRLILADHLGNPDVEPAVYQAFKFSFLAQPEWSAGRKIPVAAIEDWLTMLRAQRFTLEAAS